MCYLVAICSAFVSDRGIISESYTVEYDVDQSMERQFSLFAEILCVGNELLIGKILNSNGKWLARRVTSLGLNVHRIISVGDNTEDISSAILEAIQRHSRFLIITGGLGPTFDDKTSKGIAKALSCDLEINEDALKMVRKKYQKYVEEGKIEKAELTYPRMKMATLPKGAEPLFNPIGTAPGVIIDKNGTTIVALPGVPSEMAAIFDGTVARLLKKDSRNVTFFETSMEAERVVESEIAPLIDRVMLDNPNVYIKSHPKGPEMVHRIEFHFSITSRNSKIAKKLVSKALIELSELIQKKGGKIKATKTQIEL